VQRLKIGLTAFCVVLFFSSFAMASANGEEHGESLFNLLLRVVNLLCFLGILYHFFGKKILSFFTGRSAGIAAEIDCLERRKADALKNLAEVEQRITNLEKERQAILAEYTAQGEAMKAAILAQAEKSAAQVTAQAHITAQNEIKAAIKAMRAELADTIVQATEKLLAKKLTASEQTRLIDKYLTKVVLH
jgi:F-type H+-transporting ATPase subunit b